MNRTEFDKLDKQGLIFEMCSCGHLGGKSLKNNSHQTYFSIGHGGCRNCSCNQFTWVSWCDERGVKLE